ncbi:MAG TPA: UDP-glucose/GDP-mannose dehydrogenase family protein [Actinomycetota bacterium]|jgi:UDPglucose 6-dehydrogenase
MRVAVVGTGHVGLVTASTLAYLGHDVVGLDNDPDKIRLLKAGTAPFFEPGLEELVNEMVAAGRLTFADTVEEAIPGREVVFLCVGTPPRASGEANLVAVETAGRQIAANVTGRTLLVEKSTVPAGTARRLKTTLVRERPDLQAELAVASNPEFLREGKAIEDSLEPDRILVGADDEWAFEMLRALYEPLTSKGALLIETDIATAELSKHASNAFLALKISYANALARLCEKSGADVLAVADVLGSDHRIGRAFLNAGLGYGGYCFPKDIQAFERLAVSLGYDFPLLNEVVAINNGAVDAVVEKITDALWNLEDKRITLLGLAFKPGTDDVRLAPALVLANRLIERGATCVGYDPQAGEAAVAEVPALALASTPYEAARGAHCVVVCTEWDEFKTLDLAKLKEVVEYPIIVDGRNIFDYDQVREAGFSYYPTGRPPLV